MKNKKLNLSIILVITVIIKSFRINSIIDLACLFTTCFIISYSCFNKIGDSIKYTVFLVIIFELLRVLLSVNKYAFAENLTPQKNSENSKDTSEDNSDENKEDNKNNGEDDRNKKFKQELDDLEKDLLELDGKDEKYDKNTSVDNMSPAQAQRELYRLVDTTNLLKKTMTEMAPVLNEGKKIMKSIEALNMIN